MTEVETEVFSTTVFFVFFEMLVEVDCLTTVVCEVDLEYFSVIVTEPGPSGTLGDEPLDGAGLGLLPELDGPSGTLGDEPLDGAGLSRLIRVHLHVEAWNSAFSLSHLSLILALISASQYDLGALLGLEGLEDGIEAGVL